MMLILEPTPLARGLAPKKVQVVNYTDGRFAVGFNRTELPFRMFDKRCAMAPASENRLSPASRGKPRRSTLCWLPSS